MLPKLFLFLILILVLSVGCSRRPDTAAISTITGWTVTASSPSPPPRPATGTPLLPPVTPVAPRAAPVEGISSVPLNVRAEPSTAGNVLGVLPANTKVQITGKDPTGNWWQILYPQGQEEKGWVTAQYVTTENGTAVPVVGAGNAVDPNRGDTAEIQQQLNIRSGPGMGFNALATLNPGDVVRLTGKDADSIWLQIEFPGGPDGKGWINAAFVQAGGVEGLPIISRAGEAIGTGAPTSVPPPSTATILPAMADGDSQNNPIASVLFDPTGTHALIYSGDVSSPEGDSEDWIRFKPYSDAVFASLDCRGGNELQMRILENGQPTSTELSCGDTNESIAVTPGVEYLIRLQASQFPGGLQYTSYTIKIQSNP